MPGIDFQNIRADPKSKTDSFEALCVHLFRFTPEVPRDWEFISLRGAGGDGGVEAYFRAPDKKMIGLQAKYFFKLGYPEFSQIKGSLKTALEVHPELIEYHIYVPFNLTGKKGKVQGEVQKFEAWKTKVEAESAAKSRPLRIKFFDESAIRSKLLSLEPNGGAQRYWFQSAVLTHAQFVSNQQKAEAFAGPRFNNTFDVWTETHSLLDAFGRTADLQGLFEGTFDRLVSNLGELDGERLFSRLPEDVKALGLKYLIETKRVSSLIADIDSLFAHTGALLTALAQLMPVLREAEQSHKLMFDQEHGANRDTPGFRQFQSEFNVAFPAGELDAAREAVSLAEKCDSTLREPQIQANLSSLLLLAGPTGIGKTHALVSATKRRLLSGAYSVVLFGEELTKLELWEIVRSALGFGANVSRDELFSCLQAVAEHTGYPFLIVVDSLNDSSIATKWRKGLPGFMSSLSAYPGIRVVVSARDTYLEKVLGPASSIVVFSHTGLQGHVTESIRRFAMAYGLSTEITPTFAEELNNPLFLHLACRTQHDSGQASLDLSVPGFSALFENYLEHADVQVRERLGCADPRDIVQTAVLALAERVPVGANSLPYDEAVELLDSKGFSIQSRDVLEALDKEAIVSIQQLSDKSFVVRFSYQRYIDLLRSYSALTAARRGPDKTFDIALLAQTLSKAEPDGGLLDALAAVLPEKEGLEITDARLGLPAAVSYPAFLRTLPWRPATSITADTKEAVLKSLGLGEQWKEVYQTLIKLSLLPTNPLNAEWLHLFLLEQSPPVRDYFLSLSFIESYESGGVVKLLLGYVLGTSIAVTSPESLQLAGIVLCWLAACTDRRIRDRASKGLTKIGRHAPYTLGFLARRFENCGDDYIKERLAESAYAVSLLLTGRRSELISTLDALLSTGYDGTNVVIRDNIKLLAEAIESEASLPLDIKNRLVAFPRKTAYPIRWPSRADVQEFLDIEHLPSDMKLLDAPMAPDFWRYILQPIIRRFELPEDLEQEALARWVMQEAQNLGYPGYKNLGLEFDLLNQQKYGGGRGRPGYAERYGKKLYWISLHRLVGVLVDKFRERAPSDGSFPSISSKYPSFSCRQIDLTDLRDADGAPKYPAELVRGPRYGFPTSLADKAWAESADFNPTSQILLRSAEDGDQWVALSFEASDVERDRSRPRNSSSGRRVQIVLATSFAPRAFRWRKKKQPDLGLANAPYAEIHTYLSEYPASGIFAGSAEAQEKYLRSGQLTYSQMGVMRGAEWEYDYSSDERAEHFVAPSPGLIEQLNLSWDGHSGWCDPGGMLIVAHIRVANRKGLYIRRAKLDAYLSKTKAVLIVRRFENRMRSGARDVSFSLDVHRYEVYDGKSVTELETIKEPFKSFN